MRNPLKRLGKGLMLKGNMRILAIMAILVGTEFSMLTAIWQPFVISLGASVALLGFLQSLGGFYGVLPAIFGPIGGWISDRLGRRPLLSIGISLEIAALFMYVLAGITGNWLILIPGIVLMGIGALSWPVWDSTIAESAEKGRRGTGYAVIGLFLLLPSMVSPLIGGYIAGRLGYILAFLIAIVLLGVYLALVSFSLKETLRKSAKKITSLWGGLRKSLRKIFTPPAALRSFYLIIALDAISWGLAASIFYGMLVKSYGFTVVQIGALWTVSNIAKVASQLPVGRLIDKYGGMALMLVSQIIALFMMAGWLLAAEFEAFAILAIPFGISATTWFPAWKTLLAGSVVSAERGMTMGRVSAFRVVGFPAPFIGGILYDQFGFWAPVTGGLLGVMVTIIAIVLTMRRSS
jgi:MFS family permease